MNAHLDLQIAKLLGQWHTPQPAGDAVARILLAVDATPSKSFFARRRLLIAAPALAAAMAIGIVSLGHRDPLPKNDPLLQQSALGVFSVAQPNTEAGDLPQ